MRPRCSSRRSSTGSRSPTREVEAAGSRQPESAGSRPGARLRRAVLRRPLHRRGMGHRPALRARVGAPHRRDLARRRARRRPRHRRRTADATVGRPLAVEPHPPRSCPGVTAPAVDRRRPGDGVGARRRARRRAGHGRSRHPRRLRRHPRRGAQLEPARAGPLAPVGRRPARPARRGRAAVDPDAVRLVARERPRGCESASRRARPGRRSHAGCASTSTATPSASCTGPPLPAPARSWCGSSRARNARGSWSSWTCSGSEPEAEIAASRASGLALAALAADAFVELSTVEPTGSRTAPVQDGLEVGRRLARAVPGPPAPSPVPPGTEVRYVRAGRLE